MDFTRRQVLKLGTVGGMGLFLAACGGSSEGGDAPAPEAEATGDVKELTFEPALALFGGEDGLDFYRRLAAAWADHVAPGGLLLLEIGHTQGAAVRGLFPGATILKDIRGLDRVACVEKV